MSIFDGLLVRVGYDRFLLPLALTLACIELSTQDIERRRAGHVDIVRIASGDTDQRSNRAGMLDSGIPSWLKLEVCRFKRMFRSRP